MDNTQIFDYKTKLTQAVQNIGNESGLPVIVQRLCLSEILVLIDSIVVQQLEQEQLIQKEGDKVG